MIVCVRVSVCMITDMKIKTLSGKVDAERKEKSIRFNQSASAIFH